MVLSLVTKLFGSSNERALKKLSKPVEAINALESDFENLSNTALKAKTDEFRKQLNDGRNT